jgi:hypothetical protein
MRAWKKPAEGEIRERYLGEIAPLLEAARPVETLSPDEKRRVRKRILRTLFGARHVGLRRLLPVLVALALLVFGGAAFATAQRLGLLPRLGGEPGDAAPVKSAVPRRKGSRGPSGARPGAGPDEISAASLPAPPATALPAVPDPLLAPSPDTVWVWASPGAPAPSVPATRTALAPATAAAAPRVPSRPGSLAMSSALSSPAPAFGRPAPITPAPPDEPAAPVMPSPPVAAAPAPLPAPAVAPVMPAPPPTAAAQVAPPPATVPAAPVAKPASPDQALFGQALRKLRAENDPAAALASLREHGKAFPRSPLAGERLALEVEALLALHREHDALALLDVMALDELPRSGERLVVRGELRAAAKRWPEAQADFDRALLRVSGSPAWHERALWGRGVSRLRLGDRTGGLADLERYLGTYPRGRFAADAVKFFPGK